MQKPNLSPDDVKELELAHEAVLEAESKSSGRLRRGGSKRLDEAAAAQQVILDRVGFPTWSAYVMGASLLGIDPMAEERLERARLDLDAAEAHWADVAAAIEADPNHRALLDRLEAVYLEAFDILGGDDEQADLEHALRACAGPEGRGDRAGAGRGAGLSARDRGPGPRSRTRASTGCSWPPTPSWPR